MADGNWHEEYFRNQDQQTRKAGEFTPSKLSAATSKKFFFVPHNNGKHHYFLQR